MIKELITSCCNCNLLFCFFRFDTLNKKTSRNLKNLLNGEIFVTNIYEWPIRDVGRTPDSIQEGELYTNTYLLRNVHDGATLSILDVCASPGYASAYVSVFRGYFEYQSVVSKSVVLS